MIASPASYLIAKFVPNINRMEPRNIGVILWSNGDTSARFLRAAEAEFIPDKTLYERWVNYWGTESRVDTLRPYRSRPVRRTNPKFLEALKKTQDGQFVLEEGGFLMESIAASDIEDATEFLFRELVLPSGISAGVGDNVEGFKFVCDRLLADSGLAMRDGFAGNYSVPLNVRGLTQHWKFDYAIAPDDQPQALILRARIHETSVTSTAYKFGQVVDQRLLPASQCVSLVYSMPQGTIIEHPKTEHRNELLSLLKGVSRVVYADRPDEAKQVLSELLPAA